MSELKRVNIKVSPEIHAWFKLRSDKTGVPMSALMYLALEEYVQQKDLLPLVPEIMARVQQAQAKENGSQ